MRLVAERASRSPLSKNRICLFLGAGADISSGGITFAELKRRAVSQVAGRTIFDVTPEEEIERHFEETFLKIPSDDRALLVEWLFREMDELAPSDSYKLLVLLAEAGGVDAILTTNFDIMLEEAQRRLGRDLFQVYAPGTARPDIRSYARYELPKKPYLKLHGDLASRTVVQLTSDELRGQNYDPAVVALLTSILKTHDLVVAGYGGFDEALAHIVAEAASGEDTRVFWCAPNPPRPNSPLYRGLGVDVHYIRTSFDDLVAAIARPVLERPGLAATEPSYVGCLLDWRLNYCNRSYRKLYGQRLDATIGQALVRRPQIEERLLSFLRSPRPLAVVTGPSGFGKTTLGLRLERQLKDSRFSKILLLRARTFPESGDLEQQIGEQLGGLGARGRFSLLEFEQWLDSNALQLVVYIDGVNEFSPDLARCLAFFRGILRVSSFLPQGGSAIRVVATVRQETWNALLPHLDLAQLREVMWSDGPPETLATIACGRFSDDELGEAIEKICGRRPGRSEFENLPPTALDLLRDPYFLRTLADATGEDGQSPLIASPAAYGLSIEARVARSGSMIREATLEGALSDLALSRMADAQARFREIDIEPASLRSELIRIARDLNILVDAGDGFLQFDHDRTFEYFLSRGFAAGKGPPLDTLEDLAELLRHFGPESRPYAAARLHFQLQASETFPIISAALRIAPDDSRHRSARDDERLFGFAREVLIQLTEWRDPVARDYLAQVAGIAGRDGLKERHLRTVVQAIAALSAEEAVPLLSLLGGGASPLAAAEAHIYAIDKLAKRFMLDGARPVDLLLEAPYSHFFADPGQPKWVRAGRLAALAMQIGPDNSHPEEYAVFRGPVEEAFAKTLAEAPEPDAVANLTRHFLRNCDRLLFNASPEGIERFFENGSRGELVAALDRLGSGAVIDDKLFAAAEPYIRSLDWDIEYHLAHILFALSSLNDFEATIAFAEARFGRLTNESSPIEVDFFMAVLVYLHILHNRPYDVGRFAAWEAKVLDEWPDILLYRPGLHRGERRGFIDAFDQVFEDGFGVIFPYGILLPGEKRRSMRYRDYMREGGASGPLPLYVDKLRTFLASERFEEALQVLQAIACVVMVWPMEGLAALRPVIGRSEPRIQRALVRILGEAFNRHPLETMRFLNSAGLILSDEELIRIKIRQDARIGRRQINEEEWARLAHLLVRQEGGRELVVACVRDLLTASSLDKAVTAVARRLAL
ncbi:MAG TPA: SIR2 family protein [Allosphingosinicella sp.]